MSAEGNAGEGKHRKAGIALWVLVGSTVVSLVFGGLAAWSFMAPIDGAVIAPATITVERNRKTVQHLEGGIVRDLYVREGQSVEAGDLLLRLDPTVDQVNLAVLDNQRDQFLARRARLRAERDGKDSISFPRSLLASADSPDIAELLEGQRRLFSARWSSRLSEIELLRQQIKQSENQIAGLQAQARSEREQERLIEDELAGLKGLYAKGYVPLPRIRALEREAEQLRGEGGAHMAEIARTRNAIGEAELRIVRLQRDFHEKVVEELRDLEAQRIELRHERIAAEDRFKRREVVAPRSGTVLGLAVHTVGGVIGPGEPIMQIVPDRENLVLAARVQPQDIDKVAPGMKTVVRLSAFNQRITPEFSGSVETVSGDRLSDEATDQPYYLALIKLEGEVQLPVDLKPGMPAEAFIKTGERRAITYLLKPLTDALARSFREE